MHRHPPCTAEGISWGGVWITYYIISAHPVAVAAQNAVRRVSLVSLMI